MYEFTDWSALFVISLNRKEYYDIPWTDLRSMVEPTFAEKTLIKHSEYLSNGTIINSRAIDITATEVLTEEGRAVPYDFLVVATGHDEALPQSKTDRLEQFKKGIAINLKIHILLDISVILLNWSLMFNLVVSLSRHS